MLGARHAAERLQRCWATPFAFSIDHLRHSFDVRCNLCTHPRTYNNCHSCSNSACTLGTTLSWALLRSHSSFFLVDVNMLL